MFRRQARDPFPVRNIIAMAAIALIVLLFLFQQLKKAETAQQETSPPIRIESGE
ncbi:MAG: hypothetical protein IPM98_08395 [Lewinellaceae bacterium]|nr:hypothetical protein [Lewinellaceae bacterium]